MKYPQLLLLPVLMLADYYLTIWGAVLKDKGYANHFKLEHYELNPIWQKTVAQKRWISPRHLLLTLFASLALAVLFESGELPERVPEYFLGFLFVLFGMVIGRHLSNILIFRQFVRRPDEVSGQIVIAHSLTLSMSTFQNLLAAIPIAMIAIFSPTPFSLGGATAAVFKFVLHRAWILRHKRSSRRAQQTPPSRSARDPNETPSKSA